MQSQFTTILMGTNISSCSHTGSTTQSSSYDQSKANYCRESKVVPDHGHCKTSIKEKADLSAAKDPAFSHNRCLDVISTIDPLVIQESRQSLLEALGAQPFFIAPQIAWKAH